MNIARTDLLRKNGKLKLKNGAEKKAYFNSKWPLALLGMLKIVGAHSSRTILASPLGRTKYYPHIFIVGLFGKCYPRGSMTHFQNIKISSLFGTISLVAFLVVVVFLVFPIPQANAHTACSSGVCINLKVNGSESPVTVAAGDSVTLSWTTTGAVGGCLAVSSYDKWSPSDGYTKPLNSAGWNVGPINSSGNVQIVCQNSAGSGAAHSNTINVAAAATCTGTETDFIETTPPLPLLVDLNYTTFETCEDGINPPRQDSCELVMGDPIPQLAENYCDTGGAIPICSVLTAPCPDGSACINPGVCAAIVAPDAGGGTGGGLLPECGSAGNACTFCDLLQLLSNIVNFVIFTIAPLLAILMISVGGFLMIVSRGNPGQFGKGKSYITWAFLGYALVLSAWLIVNIVLTFLGVASWVGIGGWWTLAC